MKLLMIFTLVISLSGIIPLVFSHGHDNPSSAHPEAAAKETEKLHHGTFESVTTTNMWISKDNKNNTWVIDVEGTPVEVYVVDQEARKEISHYETIHHPAVTHQEPVYSTRTVWYVDFPSATTTVTRETYYDYNEALRQAAGRDGNISEGSEQYISSYNTVTDTAAWDETVKVIDQYAREEKGHKETKIEGEVGHWEQGKKENIGIGDGKYVSKMTRSGGKE